MATNEKKPAETTHISCEVCMKEVPINEATTPETDDYVAHFCGLECYEQWKSQDVKKGTPDKK